jgi:Zn-dependent protease
MKSSWRIARVAGVGIDIHWSFGFVILWVIIQSMLEQRAIWNTMLILVGVLLVFGCIILHEVGHAAVALSLNAHVKNIILLPFGGLAQIQATPDKPLHEFLIALAGPLVNLALVIALFPLLTLLAGPLLLQNLLASPVTVIDAVVISFFRENTLIGLVMLLVVANVVLLTFNIIPALPLDGGRMLRAVLALFVPYPRATQMTMAAGLALAIVVMVIAFRAGSIGLALIAGFIFIATQSRWRGL